ILVDGAIAGFLLIERCELVGVDALEFADLFILKKYRRLGIGQALAQQVLQRRGTWLVRCYAQDQLTASFWRKVLDELPLGSRQLWLDDEPELLNYLINPPLH